MSKNEYQAAKLRCKQALDLLGDALLQDALGEIEWIESCLCRALHYGNVARYLPEAKKRQLAAALVRQSDKRQARKELAQARAKLKGAQS